MTNERSGIAEDVACLPGWVSAQLKAGRPPRKVLIDMLGKLIAIDTGKAAVSVEAEEFAAAQVHRLDAMLREFDCPAGITPDFVLGYAIGWGNALVSAEACGRLVTG